jgi:hypothetical protein
MKTECLTFYYEKKLMLDVNCLFFNQALIFLQYLRILIR